MIKDLHEFLFTISILVMHVRPEQNATALLSELTHLALHSVYNVEINTKQSKQTKLYDVSKHEHRL